MIRFLVVVAAIFVVLPAALGFLSSQGLPSTALIVVLALIAIAAWVKGWKYLVGAAVLLWLVWSFTYPMYQAANRAMAAGRERPAQVWTAIVEAAKVAAGKVLGRGLPGAGTLLGTGRSVVTAAEDLRVAKEVCRSAAFVPQAFGEESVITYCENLGTGVFLDTRTYGDAVASGVTGGISELLAGGDPARLHGDDYLNCISQAAFDMRAPIQECQGYTDRQRWRLCMELAIQIQHDDPTVRSPVAPEIVACHQQQLR